MLIYVFAEYYPDTYKPYYDVQFRDLLAAGHDLRIFVIGSGHFSGTLDDDIARRISKFPPYALTDLPPFAWQVLKGFPTIPSRMNAARSGASGRKVRRRIAEVGRMFTLPIAAPDACLVHSLNTMELLTWLPELYPSAVISMYYHGGKPTDVRGGARDDARIFAKADVVFTNTQASCREAVREGAEPSRVVVLPMGLDIDRYVPEYPRTYRRDGNFNLAMLGRLSEDKGTSFALEAMRILVRDQNEPVVLHVIGDGPSRKDMEAFVSQHDMGRYVLFHGALPNADAMRILGSADALILSSVTTATWAETQAMVVQEALLMEAAVVTTRTGGVPESIPESCRRFCVAERDPRALAAAVSQLLRLTAAEIAEIGRAGRVWAMTNYDVKVINTKLIGTLLAARDNVRPRPSI